MRRTDFKYVCNKLFCPVLRSLRECFVLLINCLLHYAVVFLLGTDMTCSLAMLTDHHIMLMSSIPHGVPNTAYEGTCQEGYATASVNQVTVNVRCLEGGTWSADSPTCEPVTCSHDSLFTTYHGSRYSLRYSPTCVRGQTFLYNATCPVHCQYGYERDGQKSNGSNVVVATCVGNERWQYQANCTG